MFLRIWNLRNLMFSYAICHLFWSVLHGLSFRNQNACQFFLLKGQFCLGKTITNWKFRIRENMWWARTMWGRIFLFSKRVSASFSGFIFAFRALSNSWITLSCSSISSSVCKKNKLVCKLICKSKLDVWNYITVPLWILGELIEAKLWSKHLQFDKLHSTTSFRAISVNLTEQFTKIRHLYFFISDYINIESVYILRESRWQR